MQGNFNVLSRLRDIIRKDVGIGSDAQILEQVTWILFLRVYREKSRENENLVGLIPEEMMLDRIIYSNLTDDGLVSFVNNEMLPRLSRLELQERSEICAQSISTFFSLSHNYMKDGDLLRKVIEIINELQDGGIDDLFDSMLEMARCSGDLGSQYTPNAISDFVAKMVFPNSEDSVADFSFGTGNFLMSFHKELKAKYGENDFKGKIYGVDNSYIAFLLCTLNLLINNIDITSIHHKCVFELDNDRMHDVIIMNPPMGMKMSKTATNSGIDLIGGDSSDWYLTLAMDRLKKNGRAAVLVPDGFLKGTSKSRIAVKKRLFNDYNVHTIIRIPEGAFYPFTTISTSIIFFDNTHETEKTWFFQIELPSNGKRFGKTTPIAKGHFSTAVEWWENRRSIIHDGYEISRCCDVKEIVNKAYNINICGFEYEKKLSPYKGGDNYIFVSYSHKDKDKVFEIIKKLVNDGHRIWYDEGIDPGTEWDETIAAHIEGCDGFIAFISENYISSANCKDELNFARDLDKDRLLVYLENVNLPAGMAMRLNRLQAVHSYVYSDRHDFFAKLNETPMLMRN